MSKKIHALFIDPQNDFAEKGDSTKGIPTGSLYVPGGEVAMELAAVMLDRIGDRLDDVHVTLDQHHRLHIANPKMWVDSKGNHPSPFTVISSKDVLSGTWSPFNPIYKNKVLGYLTALEKNNRYPHVIWPEHCLIGSVGAAVHPTFYQALYRWTANYNVVDFVSKGSNLWSEHFGAVKAEVPDINDSSTQLNSGLMKVLEDADEIVLCGIAGSHCVANTGLDIANSFSDPSYVKKIVVLTDCIPSVPGFEHLTKNFLDEMTKRGATLSTSEKYLK